MELWDLYNEHRELIGRDHIRGEKIPQGCYHLVVHVWIRNTKGEYLISQRSANCTLPLMWECVGGSVLKGEDSLQAALRETKEEVGVSLCAEQGRLLRSVVRNVVDGRPFHDILDIWLFNYNGPIPLNEATTKEVAQAAWMTKPQIQALWDSGKFVHTLKYFLEQEEW